jgi:hypothetical protein
MLVGPAMDALATMQKRKNQEPFDLVFMDADKRAYRKCVLKERIGSKKWSYIFKLIYHTRDLYELVCVCADITTYSWDLAF